MSEPTIVPVILSGGSGSRLWPFSTEDMPKQFLPLLGSRSLFQEALGRVSDRQKFRSPVVVTAERHAEICEQALVGNDDSTRLILEPCSRNTAAAIVMAAAEIQEMHGEDALILVMPSDHLIEDVAGFRKAIDQGEVAARGGHLVTFGVRPTRADTGYGYLETGEAVTHAPGVFEVKRFVEKPQPELAEAMAADSGYLWNAGIFLLRAGTIIEEALAHAPAIGRAAIAAVAAGKRDGILIRANAAALEACPNQSIDYAVMEQSSRVVTVPMSVGWSDIGSWDALVGMARDGDAIGPVTAVDCDGCYIRSDGIEVAAVGLQDIIVVAAGNRIVILPRGRSQEVTRLFGVKSGLEADAESPADTKPDTHSA